MKTEQAKQVLTGLIKQAVNYDSTGDVVMRQQRLRTIEDLPLPADYVVAALEDAGLISCYKGCK